VLLVVHLEQLDWNLRRSEVEKIELDCVLWDLEKNGRVQERSDRELEKSVQGPVAAVSGQVAMVCHHLHSHSR
jgi:hypothetical protein